MPYLAEIAAFIVPILIKFLNRHGDDYIEKLFSKLGNLISSKTDGAVLIVSTSPCVSLEFDKGDGNIIKKIADSNGYVEFKEKLHKLEKVTIRAYGEGYISDETTLEIDNEFVTYHVSMKLRKRRKRG